MFPQANYQYQLDRQRRQDLMRQSRRQQQAREGSASTPGRANTISVLILHLWHALVR
jgi:hypothetical protein